MGRPSTAAIHEAFDEESARIWADGYEFPSEYLRSDAGCLQAAHLDFVSMVRRRLQTLSPNRLNHHRVSKLRKDNPEIRLLSELVDGMWVPKPIGFRPNGLDPPTPLRATYLAVAPAANKMLGEVVEQKLAFLIGYDLAEQHVPKLHLCKAHWTKKKG